MARKTGPRLEVLSAHDWRTTDQDEIPRLRISQEVEPWLEQRRRVAQRRQLRREYDELDDRGRPAAYRNLDKLHERIKPLMLRRRKADVETELPERTDRNYFVPLSSEQQGAYDDHYLVVSRLAHTAARRPLTQAESEKLLRNSTKRCSRHFPGVGRMAWRYCGATWRTLPTLVVRLSRCSSGCDAFGVAERWAGARREQDR